MTEKYTPEKVAELVSTANAMREQLGEDYPKAGSILDLWLRTADALAAVSADRDEMRHWAETMQAQKFEWENREAKARADRDRLHKAITEARKLNDRAQRDPDIWEDMDRILRAALDKEGSDDEV